MKKILTLLAFTFIFFGFKAVSQTTTDCNATFTYKISGDTVQFIPAAGTDSSFIYHHWSFGDTSALLFAYSPTHIYPGPGTYVVTQYIAKTGSNNGSPSCSDSSKDTIIIAQQCNIKPAFTWTIDTLTSTVYFTNTTFLPSQLAVPSTWFFGDDSSSTAWNASHTYAKPGTYYVCLRMQLGTNCVGYQCDSITIPAPACNTKASYTWKVDSLKANTIDFTNTTILPPTLNPLPIGYSIWIFGDGSALDSSFNATHTYTQAGKYYVCLRVQTGANCLSYQCDSITVPSPVVCNLQAYFNDLPDSLQYNKIHFTDYTTNLTSTDSSYWAFGDSTTSRDVNPIHVYTNPGTYNVCLTIKRITTPGAVPCVSTFCRTVTIAPQCNLVVNYSYKIDSAVTTANTYQFTNLSTPLASTDSSYWVFGDGTTSYDINPVHTFAQGGTYTVCLYVKTVSAAGIVSCSGDTCKTITITTPCDFEIGYTWALDSVNKNEVHFTNTSAVPTTASVRWAYGDGSALDSTWNTTHMFAQPGTYYVCLRIQINPNCVKYQCDSITIPAPILCNIKANYTWKIDSLNHYTVDFTNTTLPAPTTTVTSAKWSFGDGSAIDSTWDATHTYAQAGKYYVCLRVQTSATCVSYQCDSITVSAQIVPTCQQLSLFTIATPVLNTQYFVFAPAYPATDVQYTWTFGDNDGSQNMTTGHHYTNPDVYTVCLTAYRDSNCASTTCKEITVRPIINCDSINVNFNYYQNGSEPNMVYFYTTLNFPVTQQSWTITSLTNTIDSPIILNRTNPVFVFTDTGYYNVCMNVTTLNGCIKEYCKTIHIASISAPCELFAYPNPTHTQVTLNVQSATPEMIHAYVYTSQNTLLMQTEQQGNTGNNIVTINTANLAAGFYTIKLIYGNNTCYAKFQKL